MAKVLNMAAPSATNNIYGVSWNTAAASSKLTRLADAAGFADPVAALGAGAGSSPFDNILPWSGMKECNIVSGVVTAYRGDATFSRTANDTFIEIPKFWVKFDGPTLRNSYISSSPQEGFFVHPAFMRRGVEVDKIYVGKYKTGAGHVSKSGLAPLVSITRAAFRTGAAAKGTRYSQFTVAAMAAVNMLYLVEFADFNAQSLIGAGHTLSTNTAAISTGTCDSMTYHTGTAASDRTVATGYSTVYRGIEDLWGNVWTFVDGVNISANVPYFCLDHSKFADDTSANYTSIGYTISTTNGCATALGYTPSNNGGWLQLPTAVGGDGTNYTTDYYYQNAEGWRLAVVGGFWNNSLGAGPFCWNSDSTSSLVYPAVGGRLLA